MIFQDCSQYTTLMKVENEIEGEKINIFDLGDIKIEPSILMNLQWLFDIK